MPPNTCSDAKKTRKQKHQTGNHLRSNNDALYNLELLNLQNRLSEIYRKPIPATKLPILATGLAPPSACLARLGKRLPLSPRPLSRIQNPSVTCRK